MAVSDFLSLDAVNGQALIITNATPANLGSVANSADVVSGSSSNAKYLTTMGIIAYGGYRTFLKVQNGKIYKSTDGCTTWTLKRTLTSISSTNQQGHSGLRVSSKGGTATICIIYTAANGNYYADYSTDGGENWTTVGAHAGASSTQFTTDVVEMDGVFYCFFWDSSAGNADTVSFNVETLALAHYSGITQADSPVPMCVYNGSVYCLRASSNSVSLWQLGASWTNVKSAFRSVSLTSTNCHMEMFVDGAFIAVLTPSSSTVWQCDKLDSSYTVTSSNTAVPAAFNSNTFLLKAMSDSVVSGSSEPTKYVYGVVNSSGSWGVWQWNGFSSVMTLVEAGTASAKDYLSTHKHSGGMGFYTSGGNVFELISRAAVGGKLRYTFKLHSASGTDTVTVKAWRRTGLATYCFVAATLANPSAGSLVSNTITGLTANGSTSYTVDWDFATDSFSGGDRYGIEWQLS